MSDEVDLLDWIAIGKRLSHYCDTNHLTAEMVAKRAGLNESTVANIERGRQYRTLSPLWAIIRSEKLNPKWFLKGQGAMFVQTADELPVTLIRKRSAGIRRSEERLAAENGQHEGNVLEFILAVEGYKRLNNRPFPALSEIFELVHHLGYRKVEAPSINPLKQMQEAQKEPKNTPVSA